MCYCFFFCFVFLWGGGKGEVEVTQIKKKNTNKHLSLVECSAIVRMTVMKIERSLIPSVLILMIILTFCILMDYSFWFDTINLG